jgi:hypothetical protein
MKQRCHLPPLLFNVRVEEMAREAWKELAVGLKAEEPFSKSVGSVDEQALVSQSSKGLQELIEVLK